MWPKGVVCYEYATKARKSHGILMGEAMDMYADNAPGVQFVHRSECLPEKSVCNNCQSWVKIYHNRIPQGQTVDPVTKELDGCYSSVGFDSSLELNLEDRKCDDIYHYVHELGHILGLGHEHSHSKRGVIALRQGVPADLLYNLRKDAPGSRDTSYDRLSIMYYSKPHLLCWPRADPPNQPPTIWCDVHQDATNGCRVPTLADCAKEQPQISGKKLSVGDIALLNSLYPANAVHNAAVAEIPPAPVAPLPSNPDDMLHSQASLTRAVRRPKQPSKQAAKQVPK